MTDCPADKATLDGFADGSLPAAERARVTEHLAGCPECRREVAELREVLSATRNLPREILPPRDLWPGIEDRLEAPGRRAVIGRGWIPAGAIRVALAAAAALLLMVSGGIMAPW
ncbi:MAG: zf-HC2 domain-containing protein, partial [Gemmatimonadota bacterium]|nr:zf-HC2 domain-containing protein [Gemmatimonadota bacterium]